MRREILLALLGFVVCAPPACLGYNSLDDFSDGGGLSDGDDGGLHDGGGSGDDGGGSGDDGGGSGDDGGGSGDDGGGSGDDGGGSGDDGGGSGDDACDATAIVFQDDFGVPPHSPEVCDPPQNGWIMVGDLFCADRCDNWSTWTTVEGGAGAGFYLMDNQAGCALGVEHSFSSVIKGKLRITARVDRGNMDYPYQIYVRLMDGGTTRVELTFNEVSDPDHNLYFNGRGPTPTYPGSTQRIYAIGFDGTTGKASLSVDGVEVYTDVAGINGTGQVSKVLFMTNRTSAGCGISVSNLVVTGC